MQSEGQLILAIHMLNNNNQINPLL